MQKLQEVYLEDKNVILEFPADMSDSQISEAINKEYYPHLVKAKQTQGVIKGLIDSVAKSPLTSGPLRIGASMNKAFYGGAAMIVDTLDSASKYIADKLRVPEELRTDVVGDVSTHLKDISEQWGKKADELGANIVDKITGSVIGGGLPGIIHFKLGAPVWALEGAKLAKDKGESEALGALAGAFKWKIMHKVLKHATQLKQPSRAVAMADFFGGLTALEGGTPEEIAEGVGTGLGFSLMGGGGSLVKGPKKGFPSKEVYAAYKLLDATMGKTDVAKDTSKGVAREGDVSKDVSKDVSEADARIKSVLR